MIFLCIPLPSCLNLFQLTFSVIFSNLDSSYKWRKIHGYWKKEVIPLGVFNLALQYTKRLSKLLIGNNFSQFRLQRTVLKHLAMKILFVKKLLCIVSVVFSSEECSVQFSSFIIPFTNHSVPFSIKSLFQPCFFNIRLY